MKPFLGGPWYGKLPCWGQSRLVLTVVGVLLCLATAPGAESPVAQARAVLQLAPIKGGLAVHVNCGNGQLTTALGAAQTNLLVQGLDRDRRNVEQARKTITSDGAYGRITAAVWRGGRLPYADNLVNLLVLEPGWAPEVAEIRRVLAPNGVALVRQQGEWLNTFKPRPAEMDEWTHYLHDASGNAAGHDTLVGPPRHYQWAAGPAWARHHDHMASVSVMVSAHGRLFYILDEGPPSSIRLPAQWSLIARDAFNGTLLWRRPLPDWNTHLWPLKSGPGQIPRRLVAVGDRVYVTLGLNGPVAALDAATGETVRTYPQTVFAEEILLVDGVLLVLANTGPSRWSTYKQLHTFVWDNTQTANKGWAWDEDQRNLFALEAQTGRLLWQKETHATLLSLAANTNSVFYLEGDKIVRADRATGTNLWLSAPVGRRPSFPVSYGPTLVVYRDTILFAGGNRKQYGLALQDGRVLWEAEHYRSGHASPEDLLVVNGLVWCGRIANNSDNGVFTGRDVHTGQVKAEFAPDVNTYWFHHRCYRSKATGHYVLTSRTGIEFVDLASKHWTINHWVRSGCLYGALPCNGLVYVSPQACGCYLESKLNGFAALAPASPAYATVLPLSDEQRLERGPALETISHLKSQTSDLKSPAADSLSPTAPRRPPETEMPSATSALEDWPTYRHDAARSGGSPTSVPAANLSQVWRANLGEKLSSVTVAGGRVFVAAVDRHAVVALDAGSGRELWRFTAGGRVDSPPTIDGPRVLFGAADGCIYCLQATDGQLAWRFQAAPGDRQIVGREQIESAWPVSSSVLVQNGLVYGVAGRSMFLDGGLRWVRLEARTGRKLGEVILDEREPDTGKNLQTLVKGLVLPVSLPDILSSDGQRVYMRSQAFDLDGKRLRIAPTDAADQLGEGRHLFCSTGFLDDSFWHRTFFIFGKSEGGGYGGWYQAGRYAPAGRLMVFDADRVYGYGRKPEYYVNTSVLEFQLFAAARAESPASINQVKTALRKMDRNSPKKNANSSDWLLRSAFRPSENTAADYQWNFDFPTISARAMVLAGHTLFLAGPPDFLNEKEAFKLPDHPATLQRLQAQKAALEGQQGGRLWAVSAQTGQLSARYRLDQLPVFDGLAAARGRLIMSTTDGQVLCLGAGGQTPLAQAENEPAQAPSGVAVAPPKLAAADVRKEGDFDVVTGCTVLASPKGGYDIVSDGSGQPARALRKLEKPLLKKALFKVTIEVAAGSGGGGGGGKRRLLRNGFLAFGQGNELEKLGLCGLRWAMGQAQICQGALKGSLAAESVTLEADGVYSIAVTMDLERQQVTMSVQGKTLTAPLRQPLKSITHVGYYNENAHMEFSPVTVAGE